MENTFWNRVIEHGRVAEWVIASGGIAVCILGGLFGFLDAASIEKVILALILAVFGIESLNNKGA